ncbi:MULTISPECIES: GNAT family N-acetyltransferase [Streptomyces]|uniref:GNAT family N-acetyltransferase n=1 Tax=Streptomyces TaxID=1883 RepID=UPI001E5A247B|nr:MULTISPECIES: GNAT family N-acetyltransferase [Streptomyces]UFQ16637.1 GNAT family N-acetyltransferase [Streptomyces huasconensis]WCL86238.1 GNAT family N-acetyltransferase [Streptomyces sp. JCM 35825]
MNQHVVRAVRAVRAEEWPQVRELRLAALRDPVAPVAFLEAYEDAAAKPDSFWQERTAGASTGSRVRQFVAEGPHGVWAGSVTVMIEEAGHDDGFGGVVERRQAHLVGVFVRAEHRGSGVTDALFEAAVAWAWSVEGVERVRLYVHEDNPRAQAFYRRFGFVRSGVVVPVPGDSSAREFELVLERPQR